jgi:TetR/AcrR family transcriptional regulator, repressor for neighboring sulfatase
MEALLASSRKLIAERGPSIALRDIADDAGVNFGLIYHYLGTKDQLVDVVYGAASDLAAERLADAGHLDVALERLMTLGDGTTARLIGWAVLEGRGTSPAFKDSPTLNVVADLMRADAAEAGSPIGDEGARIFAAFVMTIALGWRLFAETALLAAGLDDSRPELYEDRILGFVRQLADSAVGRAE